MTGKSKRHCRTVGDIVRIDLGDGSHSYASVLPEAMFAFYDVRAVDQWQIDRILALPVLFMVAVMDHAVKRGRWIVVGHASLEARVMNSPPQFIQDPLKPDSFSLYENGAIRSAAREDCVGLERAAVWDPSHVEDRLRDHFAGRPNKWVESLRLR